MADPKDNQKPEPGGNKKPARVLHAVAAGLIILAAAAIYHNALDVPFLFDDQINIVDNPYIRMDRLSPDRIRTALFQDKFQLRLLSNFTFALDYYFHRLDPARMHGENVALHAVASLLVYALAWVMVPLAWGKKASTRHRWAAALFASLVWSVHPAHTQAVSYLVQRHTVMAAAGTLGSVLAYLLARTAPDRKRAIAWFIAAGLCVVIAAGSKETGYAAPVYILMAEYVFIAPKRSGKGRALLWPGAAMLCLLAIVAAAALLKTGILSSYLSGYSDLGYGPGERIMTESRVLTSYLLTAFFPHPARLALDHEVIASSSIIDPISTLPAVIFWAGVAFASAAGLWKRSVAAFMALGFIVSLLPESSFIPVELQNDQRIYLSSLFLLPPLSAWAVLVVGSKRAAPILTLAVIMAATLAHSRNRTWLSAASLWEDSASKSPGLARPWSNLCAALTEKRELERAVRSCRLSSEIDPDEPMPAVNRAVALWMLGRKDEAAALFQASAKRWPSSALARFNYGAWLESEGRPEDAIREYGAALEADPFHFEARLRRARLYARTGRRDLAVSELETLSRMFPDNPAARSALDLIRAGGGP